MQRKSRSQRIKENRQSRMQRAADIIEGKITTVNTKNLARNRLIIFAILIFWGYLFLRSFSDSRVFSFDNNQFKIKYEQFVEQNSSKFSFEKNIDSIIKNKTEYSYIQKSSKNTNNLIAVYEQGLFNAKVKRVGVLGKFIKNDNFDKSFIENMILTISLVFDISYDDSVDLILKMGIIGDGYKLNYDKGNIKLLYEGTELSFFVDEKNIIFNIEKE